MYAKVCSCVSQCAGFEGQEDSGELRCGVLPNGAGEYKSHFGAQEAAKCTHSAVVVVMCSAAQSSVYRERAANPRCSGSTW
jgi:hypothetical protein